MEGAPEEGEDAADVAEEVDMIADAIWTTQQGSAAGVVAPRRAQGRRRGRPRVRAQGRGAGRPGRAQGREGRVAPMGRRPLDGG